MRLNNGKNKLKKSEKLLILFSLTPIIAYLFVVQGANLIWAIYISLTNSRIGTSGSFVGLENYFNLFKSGLYWEIMLFTLIYTLGAVIFKLLFGMLMALTLNKPLKGKNLWRALLFIPWAIPIFTSALTWKWMFSDVGGIINYILMQLNIIEYPLGWLGEPILAKISVIVVNVWRGIPFFGISILAALQSIPNQLYESAKIDGANSFKQFLNITLPSIKNNVIIVSLVSTIWTLADFSVIWLMTRGGPANSTHVFSTYSYIVAFKNLDISSGIAVAISILPFSIILMLLSMRYIFKKSD